MPRRLKTTVDIVLPLYNEVETFEQTYRELRAVVDSLPYRFTFYCVDDGSTDGTSDLLRRLARRSKDIRVIALSRNFGHQAALTAGLDASQGEIVITMDGDGQHPAEMIGQMLELVEHGYDIVQGQRVASAETGVFKRWTSGGFYQMLNLISGTHVLPGAADFRALSREAVDALKAMPEYHRFLRGMISWIGYRSIILPYHEGRRVSGTSKYSAGKMLRLAMDAIFSFSLAPLYVGLSLGALLLCLALAEMAYVLSFWLTGRTSGLAPGWSSLMFVILIVGAMLMLLLGFVGVYVGYIFQEVKRRPVFLVKKPRDDAAS
ncbi:MAG TPA: glycosyltransferase family 2 protein [Anaerolineales bacterium]|nr:glycosyltransferase family 2 protein [Anaerolineales bacterium]